MPNKTLDLTRVHDIQKLVREQIIYAIRSDLPEEGGGENVMKEAWEQLREASEFEIAETEMREIIVAIRQMAFRKT
jgi:hypothetical protein